MSRNIAGLSLALIFSSAAIAADPNTIYVGADIGRTQLSGFDRRDTSFGIFGGYQVHQNFAVEVGSHRLVDFQERFGSFSSEVRADELSLSILASMSVGERVRLHGRLGLDYLDVKGSSGGFSARDSETQALYGVGASYAFTQTVSARLEVRKPASEATNLSVGLSMHF